MIKSKILALSVLILSLLFAACQDDKYTKIDDLFQPRVLDEPEVKSNSIAMVWYEVNDAVSYTVELHLDNYYKSLFATIETTDPYVFVDDIPYGTTFYIRVRSNAVQSIHNSQWTYKNATTEPRPTYAKIVEDVSKADITENSATIRWEVDPGNPADSISVMTSAGGVLEGVARYLTQEERTVGYA